MHSRQLNCAGAAVTRRSDGVRVTVIDRLLRAIGLHFVHAASTRRMILSDLQFHFCSTPLGSFTSVKKFGGSGLLGPLEGMMYFPRFFVLWDEIVLGKSR
jgi:hypothetical protein